MPIHLPTTVLPLFWDINTQQDIKEEYYPFLIERILELGDVPQVEWMNSVFPKELICTTLTESKRISVRSGNYFALKYNLPLESLLCLREPYTNKQDRF